MKINNSILTRKCLSRSIAIKVFIDSPCYKKNKKKKKKESKYKKKRYKGRFIRIFTLSSLKTLSSSFCQVPYPTTKKVVVDRSINQEKRDVDEKCAWMLGKNERMATDNFRSNFFPSFLIPIWFRFYVRCILEIRKKKKKEKNIFKNESI